MENLSNFLFKKMYIFLTAGLFLLSTAAIAEEKKEKSDGDIAKTTCPGYYNDGHWFIGADYFSPMLFSELNSVTSEKWLFGLGGDLNFGYQFSPVFAIKISAGIGKNRAIAAPYQKGWYLGLNDGYVYYPYTMIDGTVYHYPFKEQTGELLVGNQGKNIDNVGINATPLALVVSNYCMWQIGLNAEFNFTRLFYRDAYTQKPVELWVNPGLYLSQFNSQVYNFKTGKAAAPKVNNKLTVGLGGSVTLRFNVARRLAIDISNAAIWELSHNIDGINSSRRAFDAFCWQPSIGLVYRFRSCKKNRIPCTQPAAVVVPARNKNVVYLSDFAFGFPQKETLPTVKNIQYSDHLNLIYPVNKTEINSTIFQNAEELKRLDLSLKRAGVKISKITIEGTASPEGPLDNNVKLSKARAQSIAEYIELNYPNIDASCITLGNIEENWAGLRDTLMKNTEIEGRDEVLSLLDSIADKEEVKKILSEKDYYTTLLKNIYPLLRTSTYSIVYEKALPLVNVAKRMMNTCPEELEDIDLYAIAANEGFNSADGQKALSLLEKMYPETDMTLTYKGIKALKNGEIKSALSLLSKVKNPCPEATNALGVCYAVTGNKAEAVKCFSKVEAQNVDASKNLKINEKL